jgi:predicted ATP-dependent serine protease
MTLGKLVVDMRLNPEVKESVFERSFADMLLSDINKKFGLRTRRNDVFQFLGVKYRLNKKQIKEFLACVSNKKDVRVSQRFLWIGEVGE